MSARLDALRGQFNQVRSGIETIEANPLGENGDLSDDQQTEVDTLLARAAELQPDIETLAQREESMNATSAVLAKLATAAPIARAGTGVVTGRNESAPKLPTAGEYFSTFFRAHGENDPDAAVEMQAIARALDVQTTADAGSSLPKPIVGEILSIFDASRPVFASLTSQPMPTEGRQFDRPRIVTHVEVGEQAAQGDELASNKMVLTTDTVTKRTIGGALEFSRQDLDWTSPSALQLVVNDFVDQYAAWTEGAAVTALTAAITTNTSPWLPTDVGTIVQSFASGVQAVYDSSKRMPTTVWLSLDSALDLAAATNTDDSVTAVALVRQALQFVGVNLNFVIGPRLPVDTRIIGNHLRVESYEQQLGLLTAEIPSHLKRQIAYAGYVAFHLRPESVVGLVAA